MKNKIRKFISYYLRSKTKDRKKFKNDIKIYKKLYNKSSRNNFEIRNKYNFPWLKDYRVSSGTVKGDYFFHDLITAKNIFASGVNEHYDIGSRIDGFITSISVFLEKVIVLDIRPQIDKMFNIEFMQMDATNLDGIADNSIISISTLSAIEHFGLGRYGDPIDPDADIKAMKSLQRVLTPGGRLYFSVPIGKERLEYNAHRIYNPLTITQIFNELLLKEFYAVNQEGELLQNMKLEDTGVYETWNEKWKWGCGIFIFTK
jgi:SAM-dependent methyltransferase